MNKLITEMRKIDRKPFDSESQMMIECTHKNIEKLRPIQRFEQIRTITEQTKANDLRDIMWLKAPDAESWVKHIINFSNTAALMSIVGYIIGLGDRHPLNIMIQRYTGNVIHIDFGDCFEATKERAQFAETIPFRLTRMMISVLGPASVDGSFRRSCEGTLRSIRDHREVVMSILEIFIREPISKGGFFDLNESNEIISGSVAIKEWIKNQEKGENSTQAHLAKIMARISDKIDALDFENTEPLTVSQQVDLLIKAATDKYNLSCLYPRWNPLW
ncbi:PIKK family atypical protein kinase [Histomonas meleagridis]|uniref:PIKK family atypical protein kinase n=1 Tax=Histomonas meleagridis TaxID=135588 RepID=UPI00355A5A69|nr:PIKK family atypical protein kinase [Histomonas meleagridis]KAH0802109.1 PIKK family atypical protein kinase [Histomonas meleagridis]